LLKKLKLSESFLRFILYTRQLALGIELIKSSTIIAIAMTQQYIGSYRIKNTVSKMKLNEITSKDFRSQDRSI